MSEMNRKMDIAPPPLPCIPGNHAEFWSLPISPTTVVMPKIRPLTFYLTVGPPTSAQPHEIMQLQKNILVMNKMKTGKNNGKVFI